MRVCGKVGLVFPCTVALLLALGTMSQVVGQTATTGAIFGTVEDPQGKVVPAATIRVMNLLTNEARTVKTDQVGNYIVALLPVGPYKVEVEAPGFAPWSQSPVAVSVTEKVTVNPRLAVGGVTQSVHVTAEAEMVQRTSPVLGGVVGPRTIVNLPLATRNFTQLMILSPGVSTGVPNATGFGLNSIELSSNGARGADNSLEINGTDATNVFTNTFGSYVGTQGVAIPAADSLEEFKVQTGLYSAASGRNGGGNVAAVTKSGTNQFHGDVYEYFRNDALNANDFFLNRAGLKKPELKQNQFGATLGGPIQKDKTFFFGSYQGTRQINAFSPSSQQTAFLPPLTNDRSAAALGAIFGGQKGFSVIVPGGLGTAVAADGSNINPVALKLLNFKLPNGQFLIPSPQSPSGLTKFAIPAQFNEDQFNANIDHQFGSKNRISGKYFYSKQLGTLPFNTDGTTPMILPGFPSISAGRNHNLTVMETFSFSPNLMNVARFGYTRTAGTLSSPHTVKAADVGMTTPSQVVDLPVTEVLGQFTVGPTWNANVGVTTDYYSLADSVTYIRGRHSMQFGAEFKRIGSFAVDFPQEHGLVLFLDFPSFLLGQSTPQNGAPFSHPAGVLAFGGTFDRDFRLHDVAGFFQDDYRVSQRLTLTLGLRYDFFGAYRDSKGRNSTFDFATAIPVPPPGGTNSGYVVGKNTPGTIPSDVVRASNDTLVPNNNKNFEPRIGFAYQPFDGVKNLILRGGYGIYFSRRAGDPVFGNVVALPFAQVIQNILIPGYQATFQNPLPAVPPSSAFPEFIPHTAASADQMTVQDLHIQDPYMQHFSLGLQYGLGSSYLLEVGYVGSKGTHLIGGWRINQPLLASATNPVHGITTNTTGNAVLRAPIQGISTGAGQLTSGFDSSYHSLQVSLTKRFGHGLQFTSAYTFAKSLDDLSQATSGVFLSGGSLSGDQRNFSQAKGPSNFDRTHRLVFSYIWQLPTTTATSPFVRGLVNGWELAGLLTLQSGLPLTITDSTAATIFSTNTSRAQFAPGMSSSNAGLSGSVTDRLNKYFNTSAFTTGPVIGNGTGFGNSGRGILRGPDQRNFDFALVRRFHVPKFGEAGNVEFRAESFNLTNTPSFGDPGTNRSAAASFGVISNTTVNPRLIQLALKVNF